MHFSIPETDEVTGLNSSNYTVFKLHINGVYHCSIRYSQLHDFQLQLRKEFIDTPLPPFPPKKLFPLTPTQLDERRLELERFVQQVSQISHISNSSTFNGFFLAAQQASQHEACEDVKMDVSLANGYKISVNIKSTDQTEDVLEAVASKIDLQDQFVYYFGLYLVCKDSENNFSVVRKLQDFESPYISTKSANAADGAGSHWIMLRKAYWDISMDDDLMEDRVAMNLLYVQAASDVERNWVFATEEQTARLAALAQRGSKKEYLRFARTLKFYGSMMFKRCTTDYPHPNTEVDVAACVKELNLRLLLGQNEEKEMSFKVTRMRCWRIASMVADSDTDAYNKRRTPSSSGCRLELAFEYLVARNTLKWITLYSNQAILISMCLQGMVDELIMKKDGKKVKRPQDRNKQSNGCYDAGLPTPHSPSTPSLKNGATSTPLGTNYNIQPSATSSLPIRWLSEKATSASTRTSQKVSVGTYSSGLTENDAFDGIHDDDL